MSADLHTLLCITCIQLFNHHESSSFLLQHKQSADVDGIMYVINLDFPKLIEDYVHRIGRCGRCDRMGISYAFFTLNDAKQAKELIAILNEANQVFSKIFYPKSSMKQKFNFLISLLMSNYKKLHSTP